MKHITRSLRAVVSTAVLSTLGLGWGLTMGCALALTLATGCGTGPVPAEDPAVLGLWADVVAAFGGGVAFFLAHYGAHRIAHCRWRFFKMLYVAHNGHHRLYSGENIETVKYVHYKNSNVIDYLIGVPSLVLLFLILPFRAFLILGLVTMVLGVVVPWIHVSFHVKGHWLNNYRFFRHAKVLHFMHHADTKINYCFLWHFFDRLFLTFRSACGGRRPE